MTVRIGFIGVGFMGQLAHLHSFTRVAGCEVAALAEAKPILRRKVAEHHRITVTYPSHEDLLADPSIDAVVCSQPYHRNVTLGRAVLEAGKHLFTEKPMAARLDDAQGLVDLAERNGLVYAVGFMKRYDPGVVLARDRLALLRRSGRMGAMVMADATCFLGDWLHNPGQPIRTDEPVINDGVEPRAPDFVPPEDRPAYDHFLNIYSHTVNLLHFLLPDAPLACLSAHREGRSYVAVLGAGDVLITLRGAPSRSHQWEEMVSVHFERGRLEVHNPTPLNRQRTAEVLIVQETDNVWARERLIPPIEWAFYRQAQAFVEAVAGGPPPAANGRACLADVELLERIFRGTYHRERP